MIGKACSDLGWNIMLDDPFEAADQLIHPVAHRRELRTGNTCGEIGRMRLRRGKPALPGDIRAIRLRIALDTNGLCIEPQRETNPIGAPLCSQDLLITAVFGPVFGPFGQHGCDFMGFREFRSRLSASSKSPY